MRAILHTNPTREEVVKASGWEGHPDALMNGLFWSRFIVANGDGTFRENPEPWVRGPRVEAANERVTEAELLEAADLPFRWLVDRLVPRGGIVGLVGNQGAGKTPFLLQMLLSVEVLRPFLGRAIPQALPGLFWSAEDSSSVLGPRYKAIGSAMGLVIDPKQRPRRIEFKFAPPRLDRSNANALFDALAPHIVETAAQLIVFDTMAYLGLENENDAAEFHKKITFPLRELVRATDATIIVTHHTGKMKGGRAEDQGRGTSAMKSDFDALLVLEKQQDGTRLLTPAKVKGAKDVDRAPMSLAFDEDSGLFTLLQGSRKGTPEEYEKRMLAILDQHPGLSSKDVFAKVGGNRNKCIATLTKLEESGLARKESEGAGMANRWYRSDAT